MYASRSGSSERSEWDCTVIFEPAATGLFSASTWTWPATALVLSTASFGVLTPANCSLTESFSSLSAASITKVRTLPAGFAASAGLVAAAVAGVAAVVAAAAGLVGSAGLVAGADAAVVAAGAAAGLVGSAAAGFGASVGLATSAGFVGGAGAGVGVAVAQPASNNADSTKLSRRIANETTRTT